MDINSNTKTVTTYSIELTQDELVDVESELYTIKSEHELSPTLEQLLAKVTYALNQAAATAEQGVEPDKFNDEPCHIGYRLVTPSTDPYG